MRKNNDCEGAGHLILTEIEERDTAGPEFHANDFSRHTFGFVDMLSGFLHRDAVGGVETWTCEECQKHDQGYSSDRKPWLHCRTSSGLTAEGGDPHTSRYGEGSLAPHAVILGRASLFRQ